MAFKAQLSQEEKLVYIYYLQLQDRIDEAIKVFRTLRVDCPSLKLQYDYLSAYFDIFTGGADGYKVARTTIREYDNYPVAHWKMMFLAIEDLLNDFDGEFDQMLDEQEQCEDDLVDRLSSEASLKQRKRENMKKSKKSEPELNQVTLDDAGNLTVEHTNVKQVTVKYYKIDAEILISRAPFLKDNASEFSYVKPFLQNDLQVRDKDATDEEMQQTMTTKVDLPQSLKNKNLVIEVISEGK